MNILLITNDWKPKTGGISTYLRSLVENLDHEFLFTDQVGLKEMMRIQPQTPS